jgi:hypothetical protein
MLDIFSLKIKQFFSLKNSYFLVICFVLVALFFFKRNFLLFRDYSILWEGAYRLSLGQIPFTDFGLPLGPVSFFIPALFFKWFGPTWFVMQLSQMFQNLILLLLAYELLKRLQYAPIDINKAIGCFAFLYLVFLSHPWYNSSAFLFFLGSFVLLLGSGYGALLAAGFVGGLCFLAKQDYGIMNFCLANLVILLTKCDGQDKKISFELEALADFKKLLKIGGQFFLFALAFALPTIILLNWVNQSEFLYWFNYGQAPHELRKIHIWDFANHGNLLIPACIGLYFTYRTLRINLLFASIFFLCAFVVSSTSGLDYTAFFFVLFLPLLLKVVFRSEFITKKWLSLLLAFAVINCLIFPIKYLYRLGVTTVLDRVEPYSFRHVYVTRPVKEFPSTMPNFRNVMAPADSLAIVSELQTIFQERLVANDSGLSILNISELTPIYAELKSTPPLHYPLWYHTKISLFPKEIALINRDISETRFDIVLLQNTHGQTNFEEFLNYLQKNKHYQSLREKGFISPTTAVMDQCIEGYCTSHIYVFVRKTLIKN